MENLRKDTDIAVAIVASALVESALERLLSMKLVIRNKDLLARLFQNEGPMANFHGKILVAQAFGIITSPLAEELHTFRAIRNAFAHAKIPITFDNEVVLREVSDLKLIKVLFRQEFKPPSTGKASFLLAVQITLMLLECFAEHDGLASSAIAALRKVEKQETS
jgi:DNA-binding MltR family transcriptional regulator